jgi:hypothetical protein
VTGQDPYDKWPKTNGIFFVFGLDGKHLGLTIYTKLFQPGAFRIIRDEVTGSWRAYRRWTDEHRFKESIPAPPLIPPRFIKEIAWEEKKTKTPKMVTLTTGWVIHFFSSLARDPQGQSIDGWWIDEEVENEKLVSELIARCTDGDRTGKGFWSAAPQIGSRQLLELHEMWEDGSPQVDEFVFLMKDNPHISEESKQRFFDTLSEEERRVRWYGEYAYSQLIVYPEFSEKVHGLDESEAGRRKMEKLGLGPGCHVPYDWTVYASIDPGRQVCAVEFWAVPPPARGHFYVMYDELYLKQCDAAQFGKAFATKCKDRVFEALIIDHQAGRISDTGSGLNVEEQYRKALVDNKVETRNKGCYFVWGSNDPKAGILAFRELLRVKPNGEPTFYAYLPRCNNFAQEIRRYRYKKIGKGPGALITDEPEKKNDHLADCSRYLAAFGPVYVKPPSPLARKSPAVRALEAKRKRQRDKSKGDNAGIISLG